jgi:ATP/maltotriose-dependent transcriptional regulator MalT
VVLAERALALLPPDNLSARSVMALNLGMARWFEGRLADAEGALAEAERAGRGSGNRYARFAALIFLNRIEAQRGKLYQAAATCRHLIEQAGGLPIVVLAHYDLGRISLEWNDLPAGVEQAQRGIEISRRSGTVGFLAAGYCLLSAARQGQGEIAAAQEALDRAAELLEQPGISPGTRTHHSASRILLALAQGDLEAASQAARAARVPEAAGSFGDCQFLLSAQARLLLAQGRKAAAA